MDGGTLKEIRVGKGRVQKKQRHLGRAAPHTPRLYPSLYQRPSQDYSGRPGGSSRQKAAGEVCRPRGGHDPCYVSVDITRRAPMSDTVSRWV
ncbi:hypothetical protein O3P69_018112 [Scylla paramamosain]|uniref:Uncharacterized protein n=1 Tax=Scylla paramamosain TaxID=85552 RepID=A0AAW0TKT6_SCYPA